MTKFAIIQNGHSVYGIGSTRGEALQNAVEWVDGIDSANELRNKIVDFSGANDGDMICVTCSDALANEVETRGGDIMYVISDGKAILESEIIN